MVKTIFKDEDWVLKILLLLIAVSYLSNWFISLPLTPAPTFYELIWLLFLLISKRELIFGSNLIRITFLITLIYVFNCLINNYSDNLFKRATLLGNNIIPLLFCTTLGIYFKNLNNSKYKIFISKMIFYLIIIFCITSISVLQFIPEASRLLSAMITSDENRSLYLSFNVVGYYHLFGFATLLPVLIGLYKINKQRIFLVLILLISAVVLFSQIFSALLLVFLSLLVTIKYFDKITVKYYFIYLIILFASIILLRNFISDFFYKLSVISEGLDHIQVKSKEIGDYIASDFTTKNSNDDLNIEAYSNIKKISLMSFEKSPITGGGLDGGHHFWLDSLALNGLIGTIPWGFYFYFLYSYFKNRISRQLANYYLHSIILFISIGYSKNISIENMLVYLTLFIPAIVYYSNYVKNNELQK
jgi:hypothetical protein